MCATRYTALVFLTCALQERRERLITYLPQKQREFEGLAKFSEITEFSTNLNRFTETESHTLHAGASINISCLGREKESLYVSNPILLLKKRNTLEKRMLDIRAQRRTYPQSYTTSSINQTFRTLSYTEGVFSP